MRPTFILITQYGGQKAIDLYESERDLLSAASDFEPHEIEFAAEIKVTADNVRTWDLLTSDCVDASISERREAASLRRHQASYAGAM